MNTMRKTYVDDNVNAKAAVKLYRLFKNVCEDSALDPAIDWVLETPSGFVDEDLLHQAGKDDLIARVQSLIADPATYWQYCTKDDAMDVQGAVLRWYGTCHLCWCEYGLKPADQEWEPLDAIEWYSKLGDALDTAFNAIIADESAAGIEVMSFDVDGNCCWDFPITFAVDGGAWSEDETALEEIDFSQWEHR